MTPDEAAEALANPGGHPWADVLRALTRLTTTRPAPCPCCGGPMGDGDRATAGRCGLCRHRRRPIGSPRPASP